MASKINKSAFLPKSAFKQTKQNQQEKGKLSTQ